MPKANVLKKRKQFLRVAEKGVKIVTKSLILLAALSLCAEPTPYLVGYTATKKLGKAHERNRTKRRLRAAVGETISLFRNNIEYVLIGRYNTAEIDFIDLKKDLTYALKKAHQQLESPNEAAPDSHC